MSRSRLIGLLVVLLALGAVPAYGQVKQAAQARIDLLNRKAMDEYDTLEFEAARAALVEAVGVARNAGIRTGTSLSQTYLNLGIVYGAGLNDRINAVKYFTAALRADPGAELNPSRATPALEEMFESARAKVASEPPPAPAEPAFRHTPVDNAVAGRPVRVRAAVRGADIANVLLFFRAVGTSEFQQVGMQQVKPGLYVGVIPGEMIRGRSVYYYVEAQSGAGERVEGHGTALSPNIISVQGAPVGPGPGPGPKPDSERAGVFSIGLMAGAGVGIVNGGESEHAHPQVGTSPQRVDINPGGALAPFHLAPELAYHLNRSWHLCVLGRIQLVNAIDPDESSKISYLGEARAKRFFGSGDFRFYMAFGAGGGQIRHRIPLGDYDRLAGTPDDRVDARVAGFVAFGLGGGFTYMFSRYVGLVLEVNGLIVVPVFAANLDVNSGLVLSF